MTAFVVLFVVAVVPLAPTEAVLIGYGVLAASGELSLTAVIAVAAAGCALSDLINFGIGRGAGMRALARVGRRPGPRAVITWTAARLATRGESILVGVRFVPGGGLAGPSWPARCGGPSGGSRRSRSSAPRCGAPTRPRWATSAARSSPTRWWPR